jgi:hypothetical protein
MTPNVHIRLQTIRPELVQATDAARHRLRICYIQLGSLYSNSKTEAFFIAIYMDDTTLYGPPAQ